MKDETKTPIEEYSTALDNIVHHMDQLADQTKAFKGTIETENQKLDLIFLNQIKSVVHELETQLENILGNTLMLYDSLGTPNDD